MRGRTISPARNVVISIKVEIQLDADKVRCHLISMNIEMASSQLEALGSPVRLGIFRILVRAGNAGLAVGRLQEQVEMPGSTLSHHLKRLIEMGLVRQERAGTSLICHAEYRAMEALLLFLTEECCADDFQRANARASESALTGVPA
jgi:DNA-binding transcriptional ArsR family regulator